MIALHTVFAKDASALPDAVKLAVMSFNKSYGKTYSLRYTISTNTLGYLVKGTTIPFFGISQTGVFEWASRAREYGFRLEDFSEDMVMIVP